MWIGKRVKCLRGDVPFHSISEDVLPILLGYKTIVWFTIVCLHPKSIFTECVACPQLFIYFYFALPVCSRCQCHSIWPYYWHADLAISALSKLMHVLATIQMHCLAEKSMWTKVYEANDIQMVEFSFLLVEEDHLNCKMCSASLSCHDIWTLRKRFVGRRVRIVIWSSKCCESHLLKYVFI